jgi:hypothetical protein
MHRAISLLASVGAVSALKAEAGTEFWTTVPLENLNRIGVTHLFPCGEVTLLHNASVAFGAAAVQFVMLAPSPVQLWTPAEFNNSLKYTDYCPTSDDDCGVYPVAEVNATFAALSPGADADTCFLVTFHVNPATTSLSFGANTTAANISMYGTPWEDPFPYASFADVHIFTAQADIFIENVLVSNDLEGVLCWKACMLHLHGLHIAHDKHM